MWLRVGIRHSVVHRSFTSRSFAFNPHLPGAPMRETEACGADGGYAAADKRLSPCERSRSSTAASIVAPGSAAGTARTSITSPSA